MLCWYDSTAYNNVEQEYLWMQLILSRLLELNKKNQDRYGKLPSPFSKQYFCPLHCNCHHAPGHPVSWLVFSDSPELHTHTQCTFLLSQWFQCVRLITKPKQWQITSMEDSFFPHLTFIFTLKWNEKNPSMFILSLLLFRLGKMASGTLALWTWQLWEIEWEVKKDDWVSGKHTVPQLSPAVFFSAIGLWWIQNTATSSHHELQVNPNFSSKSNYTMSFCLWLLRGNKQMFAWCRNWPSLISYISWQTNRICEHLIFICHTVHNIERAHKYSPASYGIILMRKYHPNISCLDIISKLLVLFFMQCSYKDA